MRPRLVVHHGAGGLFRTSNIRFAGCECRIGIHSVFRVRTASVVSAHDDLFELASCACLEFVKTCP